MIFNITMIGLGTLTGIIINLLFNRKITIYKIIGVLIILIAGAFASFVFLNPFYFDSYNDLVFFLILICALLVGLYIAAHIIVNKFIVKHQDNLIRDFEEDEIKQKNKLKVSSYEIHNEKQKRTKVPQLVKPGVVSLKVKNHVLLSENEAENNYLTKNQEDYSKQPILKEEITTESVQAKTEKQDITQTEKTQSLVMIDQNENVDASESLSAFAQNDEPERAAVVFDHEQTTDTISAEQLNADSDKDSLQAKKHDIAQTENTESLVMIDQNENVNASESLSAFAQNDELERVAVVFDHEQTTDTISAEPNTDSNKYTALMSKASELMKQTKYLYAGHLLQMCLNASENKTLQKQADLQLLECLVFSNQYKQAQNKWFDILNKKYAFEPADKIKLKALMSELKMVDM